MSKRQSQNLNDACVDDEPERQSMSENGKPAKKTAVDVIDNDRDVPDLGGPGPSTLKEKESTILTSNMPSDERSEDIIDGNILRRSDQEVGTSSIPLYNESDQEFQHADGTPWAITAPMIISKDEETYNMSHQKRGTCLVFNQEKFVNSKDNLEGSSFNVERIETTFGGLGFDVVVHNNLKFTEVMEKIEMLSKPENHKDNDCVCVFVLTHGLENGYLLTSDNIAYPSNKIWQRFTADHCPTLAGKPKLFFFEACRGGKPDHGVRIETSLVRQQTDGIASTTRSYTLPKYADFLIAHSSMDGFPSWRRVQAGSWYTQTLCNVLDEFGNSKDLLKMLTITARRVATGYQSSDKQKQVPTVMSTLTRDLYFTSK